MVYTNCMLDKQGYTQAHAHAPWPPDARTHDHTHTHTHRQICNTYCFSMATLKRISSVLRYTSLPVLYITRE
jgi:hypothetical protein